MGDFELGRQVGVGGMGLVYLAEHRPTGTTCAVKLLAPDRARHPRAVELFLREVRAGARLDHPGILRIHDAGQHADGPWFAMERAEMSLFERRPESWNEVLDVLRVVLGALTHAHARGVVHRDIKPANLMYCRVAGHLHLRLGDFGIARLDHELAAIAGGTPGYMAPEQALGSASPATDLFAVGVLAYELLSGDTPFPGVPREHDRPPPLERRMEAPPAVQIWVEKLLSWEPSGRPRDAATALNALNAIATGQPITWDRPTLQRSWFEGRNELPEGRGPMGLGLVGLRQPPLHGREALQGQLWKRLRAVASQRRPLAVELRTLPGEGGSRLGQWLMERAAEVGAHGVFITGGTGPTDGLQGLASRLIAVGHALPNGASLVDGVLQQLESLRDGPAVLWVDSPPGDPEVQRLVTHLLGAHAVPLPILVVLTTSPAHPWPLERFACECIPVPPLSVEEKAAVLTHGLGLTPESARKVAAIASSLRGAIDRVQASVALGQVRIGPAGASLGPVDADAAEAARLQLQTLSPSALAALQVAALLGDVVDDEVWEQACEAAGRDLRGAEAEGIQQGVLREEPGGRLTFARDGLRQGLVRSLFSGEARRLHSACAEALGSAQPGRQGMHWFQAERLELAFETMHEALQEEDHTPEHLHLAECCEDALQRLHVPQRDLRWGRLLARWVQVHLSRHAFDDLWEAVDRLLGWMDAHDGWSRMPTLIDSAVRAALTRGRRDDAIRWLAPALQHLEKSPAKLLRLHGLVMQQAGRYDEAIASFRSAREHWPDGVSPLTVLNDIAVCQESAGQYEDALATLRSCLALPGVQERLPLVKVNVAGTLLELGRVDEAMGIVAGLDPAAARTTDSQFLLAHAFAGTLGAALAGDDAGFAVRAPRLGRLLDIVHFRDFGVARSFARNAHELRRNDRSATADRLRSLANTLCRDDRERASLDALDPGAPS